MAETMLQSEDDAKRQQLLGLVRKALEDAGFEDLDVSSITLYAKTTGPRICPDGKPAVWGEILLGDGSTYIGWICK
jgi:hypothetical protein